jgi:hypothetical protein
MSARPSELTRNSVCKKIPEERKILEFSVGRLFTPTIEWSPCNGGLAAVDSSIEEDRDRNMVVATTIRAATAIVIRIMAPPRFDSALPT